MSSSETHAVEFNEQGWWLTECSLCSLTYPPHCGSVQGGGRLGVLTTDWTA